MERNQAENEGRPCQHWAVGGGQKGPGTRDAILYTEIRGGLQTEGVASAEARVMHAVF